MPITTLKLHLDEIKLSRISGIAVDSAGTIYISDYLSCKIFRLVQTPDGLYDLFVVGEYFENPRGLLIDGNDLYIAHSCTIHKLSLTSNTITFVMKSDDDKSIWPFQMAIDPVTQELYFTQRQKHPFVSKVTKDGTIQIIGNRFGGFSDGNYKTACFWHPSGIAINSKQEIFVADAGNHCIRKIHNGQVTTIAGQPRTRGYMDGDANQSLFENPAGLVLDRMENLIIADYKNKRIRKLDFRTNTVFTLAGSGRSEVQDGSFLEASFSAKRVPFLITYQRGALYVGDNSEDFANLRIVDALPWRMMRLLWIGKLKNGPECPFANLPRDLIRYIMKHFQALDLGSL